MRIDPAPLPYAGDHRAAGRLACGLHRNVEAQGHALHRRLGQARQELRRRHVRQVGVRADGVAGRQRAQRDRSWTSSRGRTACRRASRARPCAAARESGFTNMDEGFVRKLNQPASEFRPYPLLFWARAKQLFAVHFMTACRGSHRQIIGRDAYRFGCFRFRLRASSDDRICVDRRLSAVSFITLPLRQCPRTIAIYETADERG